MDDAVRNDPPADESGGADAATRAELDDLRRRAYGPGDDTLDDQAAERLEELERLVRGEPDEPAESDRAADTAAAKPHPQADHTASPPADEPRQTSGTGPPPGAGIRRSRTVQRALCIAAGVAAIAIVAVMAPLIAADGPAPSDASSSASSSPPADIATSARFVFPADPYSEPLLQVRLDGSFGTYVDVPTADQIPAFPSRGQMEWVSPLGDYYGWRLWIAGGGDIEDPEHCILITDGDETRSRCVTLAYQRLGVLRVSLASDDIDADEQPVVMRDDQRVRFQWREDGVVDVVLGSFTAP